MLAFGDILSIKFRRRKVIVNTRKSTLFEGIFCNALSILYHTIRIISIRNFKIRGRRLSFLRLFCVLKNITCTYTLGIGRKDLAPLRLTTISHKDERMNINADYKYRKKRNT